MNGTGIIATGNFPNPGPSWHAIGTGDFNGDGHSDILLQNSSGEVDIWELNGASVIAAASVANPGPSWHVKGTGDFNGDGFSDVLWQNDDGSVAIWE
jgi:serralysin